MHVVATAGHVDHGKSTLVRALTGIEPDRWEQERRRGLTIDLGYAWTTLPSGAPVAFVDVPGHEHFVGNMLAGLGPVPAVVLVVAADEGWRRQSGEHLAAVDALGLRHGLVVVTRADLADPEPARTDALSRVARTSLAGAEAVTVSARTGDGLEGVRAALDRLVGAMPRPDAEARVRLWVDRSFSIRGAGTVVTGTLGAGTLRVGDELHVQRADGSHAPVTVRGLQSQELPVESVGPVNRVAVNLRGVAAEEVARGDTLVSPRAWRTTASLDVRVEPGPDRVPAHLMLHVGSLAVEVRTRPLGPGALRLGLPAPLPLTAGDRLVLRDPGSRRVTGALVVDADPPPLHRRGAGARRAEAVATMSGAVDLAGEVLRRGAMPVADALALGASVPEGDHPAPGVTRRGRWLVADASWQQWGAALHAAVTARAELDPLDPVLTLEAARAASGLPDRALVGDLAAAAGLEVREGRVGVPGGGARLGARAEEGLLRIEERMAQEPFRAPEQKELDAAGLGARELAAAVRAGRLVRLPGVPDDVHLLPIAPARAMRVLAGLPQPFTTSQAREALATTRRTVIPLLEHLDARGWTRRVDGTHREVRR